MKTYPVTRRDGRVVEVTVPENAPKASTFARTEYVRVGENLYELWIDGALFGCVNGPLPAGYCGHCGGEKTPGQSCGCFDNGCE